MTLYSNEFSECCYSTNKVILRYKHRISNLEKIIKKKFLKNNNSKKPKNVIIS